MINQSSNDEYEAIAPREQSVTLSSGKQLSIRPMTIATVAKMARAVKLKTLEDKATEAVRKGEEDRHNVRKEFKEKNLELQADLLDASGQIKQRRCA